PAGLADQAERPSTPRCDSAAACRSEAMIVAAGACHSWFCSDDPSPEARTSDQARKFAVRWSSHPVIGDHFTVLVSPERPCGSKTPTGPFQERSTLVPAMLSVRLDVDTTGPGASGIASLVRCSPLPDRGGPQTQMESSIDPHT